MVKKKVEMEVDFPECISCGKGIFARQKYFDINIRLSKMTVDFRGGSDGISTDNFGNPLIVCENCFSNEDMDSIVKLRIIMELERLKRELEQEKEQK